VVNLEISSSITVKLKLGRRLVTECLTASMFYWGRQVDVMQRNQVVGVPPVSNKRITVKQQFNMDTFDLCLRIKQMWHQTVQASVDVIQSTINSNQTENRPSGAATCRNESLNRLIYLQVKV